MSQSEKLLEITGRVSLLDLPIGVYIATRGGRILAANREARHILRLPPEGELDASIIGYYTDPSVRESLHAQLEEHDRDGQSLATTLSFTIGGREVFVRDYTRALRDAETGAVIGHLCCIIDVTEEVRYRQTFDDLPVGAYVLDEHDRIADVNEAFASLLGRTQEELVGTPVHELYADPVEAAEFRELLEREGTRVDHITQVLNKEGDTLFVRVSATRINSPSGEYGGREGTIMKADKEPYRRLLEVAPIGLYEVQRRNGADRVVHCNDQFLAINEFESRQQVKNFDMRDLHAAPEDYDRFMRALEESSRQNRPLHNQEMRIRTLKGNEKVVDVSVSAVFDRQRNVIGRVGAVRDITPLKHEIVELTEDIGNFLHDYSHNLLESKLSIDAIIESLQPDPFRGAGRLRQEDALTHLAGPAARVAENMARLSALAGADPQRRAALAPGRWEEQGHLTRLLGDYEKEVPNAGHRLSAIREAASAVVEICDEVRSGLLPKERVKDIRAQALDLLRILNLFLLHQMLDVTLALGHQVGAVREFALSGVRLKEPRTTHSVEALITVVAGNVAEFARERKVEFRKRLECPDAPLRVVERDVVRALTNILHNAIKYSWSRSDSSSPWIGIRAHLADGKVNIEFENYGVPIPRDEIDQKLVFRLGYRGKMSSDRGRAGTGVGLADALRVAREHGGDVLIKSQPAIFGRSPDDLSQPFRTTVTFILPAWHE